MLEELGLPYQVIPVDTGKGEQHKPEFRAINPNGKVPAIVDTDGPDGKEARVFDSTAILLYLGHKTGRLIGSAADLPELLSWLLFIATGIGPFSGQAVHFQHAASEKLAYAINRYRREVERHYEVLDTHLKGREFIVGTDFSIADISAWGWLERAPPAAMNKNREWRILVALRQEEIDGLPRGSAIGQAELGAAVFEHLDPIKLRFMRPAGKNLGVLGHTRAIVIFNFVVDRGHHAPP